MKKIILLILLIASSCSTSQVKQERKMYRIQDTTLSQSGWYFGKSTDGHFSIELPIPFNDFTLITEGIFTYVIGSKSQEGYKFSVTEMKNKNRFHNINLDEILEEFKESDSSVTNITKAQNKNSKSIYFELKNKNSGAFMKYIYSKNRLFTLIIEYPIEKEKSIIEFKENFFSSFTIN